MPPAAVRLLADLSSVLADLGLRWYVFGAQAVVVHGRPRLTEDVDVTVELGELDATSLAAHLERAGFDPASFVDAEFLAATQVLPFVHVATGMPLDVVLAGPGLEEIFLAEAEPVDVGGLRVPVLKVEHLLVTKVLAARPKDLEDARGILRGGAAVQLGEVRDLLSELERALGRSDLVTEFNVLAQCAMPDIR